MLLIICQVFYTVAEHSRSIMSVGKICIVIVCVCGNDRRVTKMVLSRRLWNRLTSPMRQNWRSTVWRLTSWASVDTRTSSESTSRTISTANCVYVYAAICQLLYIRIYTTLQYNTIQYNTIQYMSIHKSFFDFNEIWHARRGRWVMQDDMQYDQMQGRGHKPFKVGSSSVFSS